MTKVDEIERLLDIATHAHDHVAYAAAARVHWPQALLDLRDTLEELDDANSRLLRAAKLMEAAHRLYEAGSTFIQSLVRHGPDSAENDVAAAAFFIAQGEFNEARERLR